jgi:hypothetical protein
VTSHSIPALKAVTSLVWKSFIGFEVSIISRSLFNVAQSLLVIE